MELEKRNQELELLVRELLSRLNSNSSNSHKPPSSDPPQSNSGRFPSRAKSKGRKHRPGVARKMLPPEKERNSAMAMGRYFRKSEPVSAFVESQQQSIKTSSWELFRLPDFRSVGKLFYISSSDAPALSESFDSRFSKGSRPGSRGQKTWCLGRQRVEKCYEDLEGLPPWANFTKAAESVGKTDTQPVQDSGEMRASIERPIYGSSLQKSQEEVGGGLVVRKIPGKSRTNQQSSGKSLAKTGNLAKDFTGQQIAKRHDFRSEINDNYDFSCPTGPECNGFSRNYAQKFSSGLSTAKTEFKSRCIKQQKHFAHLTVEKSIFEQSSAYAKIWSCGSIMLPERETQN